MTSVESSQHNHLSPAFLPMNTTPQQKPYDQEFNNQYALCDIVAMKKPFASKFDDEKMSFPDPELKPIKTNIGVINLHQPSSLNKLLHCGPSISDVPANMLSSFQIAKNMSNTTPGIHNNLQSSHDGKRKRTDDKTNQLIPKSKRINIPRSVVFNMLPPKAFLGALLRKRGYSTETYSALDTAYYNKPTQFQQASYGTRITQAARTGDVKVLYKLIKCGLSRNPCNKFGESVVHIVCRRGSKGCAFEVLDQLCKIGCELQVCDDFGKTPLHDACWTVDPCFRTISLILDKDIRLLHMKDRRGSTPLDYLRKEKWRDMIEYLIQNRDRFWPHRDVEIEGVEPPPSLSTSSPHSHEIQDPSNALPMPIASLVAAGKIDPETILEASDEDLKSFHSKLVESISCPSIHSDVSFGGYVFSPAEKANFLRRHFHVSFPSR